MKICVVGMGYMGIPTALLLAKNGHNVFGHDVVKEKVEMLNNGELPFEEKGMPELLLKVKSNFRAVHALEQADVFLVAVPTPITKENKCDLSYVRAAIESLVPFIKKGVLVILESTVRPGTTEEIVKPILEKSGINAGDFSLAYVAEKAIPGNTLHEMVHNDRIIGGIDDRSKAKVKEIYSFVKGSVSETDCTTAETVKLIENAYRDVNIALANEIAKICEKINVNVWEAIDLANKHPRVNIHQPGPGVGGHCIAVDPWFLIENSEDGELIAAARKINDSMPSLIVQRVESLLKGRSKPVVAILGAAYKKNVDDARESPSKYIAELCRAKGYEVRVTDPFVRTFSEPIVDFEQAVKGADCVIIATDHERYKSHEGELAQMARQGVVILDSRNLFKGRFSTLGKNE